MTYRVVNLDLRGHTALVTGAASGIGRVCAARLASAGARVVAVDRDADALKALDFDAEPVVADLAEPDAAEARLAPHLGAVDVLVNNAGLQHIAPLPEFPPERFAYLQQVLVEAPFRLARRILPGMYQRGWG